MKTGFACLFPATILFLACGGPDPEPVVVADIVPYVRIVATETLHEAFPWPIEAQDAAATIRDGNPSTSWKLPAGEDIVLTLDIQPWVGQVVPLKSASIVVEGDVAGLTVRLLGWCGATDGDIVAWTDNTAPLDLSGHDAGCIELHFTVASNSAVSFLEVDAEVPESAVAAPKPPASPRKVADGRWDGVIEGFYGVPWSWDERGRMIDLLARTGMGTYLYCPKWDPMHRERWREPYSADEMDRFGELIAHASDLGVSFSFGISPFIDFDATGDDDYQTLLGKVMGFVDRGARNVTLLADDIEFETGSPIDATMGAMHATTVNRLLADLRQIDPDIRMAFCPTVYSDERIESLGEEEGDGAAYLAALSALDPSVQILWTGTATSSAKMSAADMDAFRALTGRKPLIWDNFWANDGGDGFIGRIMLSPFTGRTADLPGAVAGIMHNTSIQGGLARLTLATFADYLADPAGYDPAAAVGFAAGLETTSGASWNADTDSDRDTVAFVMALFDGNAQKMPGHDELLEKVATVAAEVEAGSVAWTDDVVELAALFGRMAAIESEVHHSALAADIVDELIYPLQKIRHDGETGLALLTAMSEKAAGRSASGMLKAAAESMYDSNSCRFSFGEGQIDDLFEAVSGMAAVGDGPGGLTVTVEIPTCSARMPVVFNPSVSVGGAAIRVFGLPGARVAGASVEWTPPHAGVYRAVFTAAADGAKPAAGWVAVDVVCDGPEMNHG